MVTIPISNAFLQFRLKWECCKHVAASCIKPHYIKQNIMALMTSSILIETSKPPLNIFSYFLTYIKHIWLQFTLKVEKANKQSLSKFHFHKLKLTCSIDRLYKSTIAFPFHTNAKI